MTKKTNLYFPEKYGLLIFSEMKVFIFKHVTGLVVLNEKSWSLSPENQNEVETVWNM